MVQKWHKNLAFLIFDWKKVNKVKELNSLSNKAIKSNFWYNEPILLHFFVFLKIGHKGTPFGLFSKKFFLSNVIYGGYDWFV